MKERKSRDYKEDYETTWKEIVENPDGTVNKDQLMRELSDFSMLIDHLSRIYCLASGNRVSYPHTNPEAVYQLFEEQLEERYNSGYKDATEDTAKENPC